MHFKGTLQGRMREKVVKYFLRLEDRSADEMTMTYEKSEKILTESQTMFYCQTEDMSTVLIDEKNNPKREKRNIELLFDDFKMHCCVDRKFYGELLNESIAKFFLQKLMYIRVLFDSRKSINFLNPGYYFCHVPSCGRPQVQLRGYNSLVSIDDHWKQHTYKDKCSYDESCVILRRPYNHLKLRH